MNATRANVVTPLREPELPRLLPANSSAEHALLGALSASGSAIGMIAH